MYGFTTGMDHRIIHEKRLPYSFHCFWTSCLRMLSSIAREQMLDLLLSKVEGILAPSHRNGGVHGHLLFIYCLETHTEKIVFIACYDFFCCDWKFHLSCCCFCKQSFNRHQSPCASCQFPSLELCGQSVQCPLSINKQVGSTSCAWISCIHYQARICQEQSNIGLDGS